MVRECRLACSTQRVWSTTDIGQRQTLVNDSQVTQLYGVLRRWRGCGWRRPTGHRMGCATRRYNRYRDSNSFLAKWVASRRGRFCRAKCGASSACGYGCRTDGCVDEAEQAAAGVSAAPPGRISMTGPALFGKMFVIPVIVDFLKRHDKVDVSALLVDRVVY